MIENQEQANARANEIVKKYPELVDAFRGESAKSIADNLVDFTSAFVDDADYSYVVDVFELIYYLDPNYCAAYALTFAYLQLEQYDDVVEIAQQGLDYADRTPNISSDYPLFIDRQVAIKGFYTNIIKALILLEDFNDAVSLFESIPADEVDNGDIALFTMLAETYNVLGDSDNAQRLINLASSIAQDSPDTDDEDKKMIAQVQSLINS